MLQLLLTVPQKWRFFWALESIGISFSLAVAAIFYIGESSSLLQESNNAIQFIPTWFVWGVNPVAVTVFSYLLSSAVQSVCDYFGEAYQGLENPTARVIVKRAFADLVGHSNTAKERLIAEPCFYALLAIWVAQVVPNGHELWANDTFPLAITFAPTTTAPTDESYGVVVTDRKTVFLCMNAVLVAGLAMMACRVLPFRRQADCVNPEHISWLDAVTPNNRSGSLADSRVPSLLVGWGFGYWVASLLYVLLLSWHGGGWTNTPIILTIAGYIILPCFAFVCVFMVCDTDFLGAGFGAFVGPAVSRLKNRRTAEYWVMASILRDILLIWINFCDSIKSELLH